MKNKYLSLIFLLLSVSNSSAETMNPSSKDKLKSGCTYETPNCPSDKADYPYCVNGIQVTKGTCPKGVGTRYTNGYCCIRGYWCNDGSNGSVAIVYAGPEGGGTQLFYNDVEPSSAPISCPSPTNY